MSLIDLPGARGAMPTYVAAPTVPGPWPGVVVISDALGMTTDLTAQADWLATEGYLAAAPDINYWGGRIRCMFASMRQLSNGQGHAYQDFETVRRWMIERDDCTGRVGVIGFCLGGGFALALAMDGNYSASSVNYGSVPEDALDRLADACPVVGSYGGRDRSLRGAPERLEEALSANQVPHDVVVYPDAGHSFLNDHLPDEMPWWALVTGRFAASGYHGPSADDARRRIIEFFARHLKVS